MTLDQLKVFIAVAEREHVTRAAEFLNITQSTASAAIQSLEKMHGVVLFHRVGRRIELTETGKVLLREAKALLGHADLVQGMISELGGIDRGTLSIWASQTIGSYWLPPQLVRFRQEFPDCNVQISVGTTDQVRKAVISGEAEIGIVGIEVDDDALSRRVIGQDNLMIVVGLDHPWGQMAQIGREDLVRGRWVMREAGAGTRSAFETRIKQLGIPTSSLKVVMELPTDEALQAAVKAGIGATVLSDLVIAAGLKSAALRLVRYELPPREFYVLQHRERFKTKLAAAFLAMITNPGGSRRKPQLKAPTRRPFDMVA